MRKQTIFLMIMLVVAIMAGWNFPTITIASDQPAVTQSSPPATDTETVYSEESDMEAEDPAGDEEAINSGDAVSSGDAEEGAPISSEGEVEDTTEE